MAIFLPLAEDFSVDRQDHFKLGPLARLAHEPDIPSVAVDDGFRQPESDTHALRLTEQCEYPVEDDDPERTGAVEVHATTKKQGRKVREFERASVALFVPFGS